jgi:hypothetical protein
MTNAQALKIAEQIANGNASLTIHAPDGNRGANHAIRISGCTISQAKEIGRKIALAFPGGAYRQSEGFSCVWFDRHVSLEQHNALLDAHIEELKSHA